MNAILIIFLCIAFLFFAYVVLVAVKMSGNLAWPTYKTWEFTIKRSKEEENSYGDLDSYEKEPFDLTLRDGYEIHGEIYPLDTKKVVIISHGHGDNKYTGIRFLQVFRDLGYTTVIYDLRGHGHNKPFVCTMGINESKDLIELIDYMRKQFPEAEIGLHGLSMGCATTVTALKNKPDVKFVVADCGYAILKDLCRDILKASHQPVWLYGAIDLCYKLRCGHYASEVNPIDSLDENEIPILFVHGTEDKLISFHHSEWMYERNKGRKKELHLIPDAAHAHAWNHDPAEYEKIISDFLEKSVNCKA